MATETAKPIKLSKKIGTILRDNPDVDKIAKTFPTLTEDMLKDIIVPKIFSGKNAWFDYIPPIANSLDCPRDWLLASVECLSTRYNIWTHVQRNIMLTSGELIYCSDPVLRENITINDNDTSIVKKDCTICTGSIYYAMKYLYTYGAPLTSCLIYEDVYNPKILGLLKKACEYPDYESLGNSCDEIFINDRTTCPTSKKAVHRFRCRTFANVEPKEITIMKEIYKNGPVICGYKVYDDFINEYNGKVIYQGPVNGSKLLGGHAGKIVGWGEEKGIPFWIVSNTWSQSWGLSGYFRILRGKNICDIESNVVTLYPDFPLRYNYVPEALEIKDPLLNELRLRIEIDLYNYYEPKTIKQIEEGKVEGNLGDYWDFYQLPNLVTTNAAQIENVPILYTIKRRTEKINTGLVVLMVIFGLILGFFVGYLIYKVIHLNKDELSVYSSGSFYAGSEP